MSYGCFIGNCQKPGQSERSPLCSAHAQRGKRVKQKIMTPRECVWCGTIFLATRKKWRCDACLKNPPKCAVPECTRLRKHDDWCGAHYHQQHRGEELRMTRKVMTAEQKLLSRRSVTPEGCWEWTGRVCTGYGRVNWQELTSTAAVHRVAYEMWVGEIPPGEQIHHKCANRLCFNPDHLQAVTQRENVAEMKARRALETRIAALEGRIQELEAENLTLRAEMAVAA